jgi:hypothetical protein
MKPIELAAATVIFAASTVASHASTPAQTFDLHYSGNITFHNDVAEIPFTIPVAANGVRVWTDSFHSGKNFDPILAVWNMSTGKLVAQNDDNSNIGPGQTFFDSGLSFGNLGAGPYMMTITQFSNFANSDSLSSGFNFDHETPRSLSRGTYWEAHISGSVAQIPEPEAYAMLLAGIGLLSFVARRKQKKLLN